MNTKEATPIKQSFFNSIAQEFDDHVRQSIPLFDQFIQNVRWNIIHRNNIGNVLDICGSTGKLGYDLIQQGFDGKYVNVDGSPQMIEICKQFAKKYPARIVPRLQGFMADWEDESGQYIYRYDHERDYGYYDFVLEILGFQFFTKDRVQYFQEMKKLSRGFNQSYGISVIFEKTSQLNKVKWQELEDLKDKHWKSKFFTQEEIEAKKKNVLEDMGEYCVNNLDLYADIKSVWRYVEVIYVAGNFRGFACSDTPFQWLRDIELVDNIYNG